jgi:hypothetical protein
MEYLKNEIWKENYVKAVNLYSSIYSSKDAFYKTMFILGSYYTYTVHVQPTESGSIGSKPSAPWKNLWYKICKVESKELI